MTLFWILNSFMRWVRLKIYQYEVTFAVYMLTPTEKFIFSMFIWLKLGPPSEFRDCNFSCIKAAWY